ncbi:MAG: hypothetical protein PHC98_02550 [Syntrophotalea acetylenica]|nr:hypothetical protein [Syntrophotalea acetylenica]
MRKFGVIYTKLWTKKEFLALDTECRLLFLYLLTGPHTTSSGCFRAPKPYISADLGWPPEVVDNCLLELSTAKPSNKSPFIKYCPESEWILIPRFLAYNPIANPNIGKNVMASLELVPDNFCFFNDLADALQPYADRLDGAFLEAIRNRSRNGSTNGSANGSRNQYKDKYKDKDQYKNIKPESPSLSVTAPGESENDSPLCVEPPLSSSDKIDETSSVSTAPVNDEADQKSEDSPLRIETSRLNCPHQKIIELYHETCPELPQVKVWNVAQKKALSSRWAEDPERQSLQWWREMFQRISRMDFLMGKTSPTNARPPFRASLGWIVLPTNFAKILNGHYPENDSGSSALTNAKTTSFSPREQRNLRAAEKFIAGASLP